MKILTDDLLVRLTISTPRARCAAFVAPINAAFDKYGIVTLDQRAAFLATIAHESALLTRLVENLNYGAQGLLQTWPKRFNIQFANAYARQPERIANHVYANRMGNGDEASGDGWRYRGAGLIQLTGKEMHEAYAAAAGEPLKSVGDWLRTPEGAADSAGWFWQKKALNEVAKHGDMKAVTLVVNGGVNGLVERVSLFNRAKVLLA